MSMERSQPRLAIGMPVYNAGRYIADVLDSILAQTFTDFVLTISDNASTDETERVCRDYAARDRRIVYHRNDTNIGGNANFNLVFSLSPPCEYFKWQAHDDLLEPAFLAATIAELDRSPDAISCHSATVVIDDDGRVIAPLVTEWPAIGSPSPARRFAAYALHADGCVDIFALYRRARLAAVPPLGDFVGADVPYLAEIALHGPMMRVDEPLFLNRDHDGRYSRVTASSPEARADFCRPGTRSRLATSRFRMVGRYYGAWWRARRRLTAGQWLRCFLIALAAPFHWPEPRTLMAELLYMISPRLFFGARRLWRMGRRLGETRA